MPQSPPFLEKALESLAGAQSEFANGRFNNVANRCYYAAFQAAIVALQRAGLGPRGGADGGMTLYPLNLRACSSIDVTSTLPSCEIS